MVECIVATVTISGAYILGLTTVISQGPYFMLEIGITMGMAVTLFVHFSPFPRYDVKYEVHVKARVHLSFGNHTKHIENSSSCSVPVVIIFSYSVLLDD